jgi:hypothetical protein
MDIKTLKEMMAEEGFTHTSKAIRLTKSENRIPYLRIAKDAKGSGNELVCASKNANALGVVKEGMSFTECLPLNVAMVTNKAGEPRRKFTGPTEDWQEVAL